MNKLINRISPETSENRILHAGFSIILMSEEITQTLSGLSSDMIILVAQSYSACCVTPILAQVETVVQTPGAFLAVSPIRRGPFFIIYTKIIKLFPEG